MRFLLLITAVWTAILARKSSADSIEAEPILFDFGNTGTLQASNLRPLDTGDSFQDENYVDNVINVNEATTVPFSPPVGESFASDSNTPDDPGTDENLDNMNIDSLTATLDPLTDTNNLEAKCIPGKPATPGKLRKRQNLSCPPRSRVEINPDADTTTNGGSADIVTQGDLDRALEEDREWKKKHAMAALKSSQRSKCGSSGGFHRYGACCPPPPLIIRGYFGNVLQEWTSFKNCQPFFEGRPWCADVSRRKCCHELWTKGAPVAITEGTVFGDNCIPMPE